MALKYNQTKLFFQELCVSLSLFIIKKLHSAPLMCFTKDKF